MELEELCIVDMEELVDTPNEARETSRISALSAI